MRAGITPGPYAESKWLPALARIQAADANSALVPVGASMNEPVPVARQLTLGNDDASTVSDVGEN